MKKATAKNWIAPALLLAAALCGCFFAFFKRSPSPIVIGVAPQPGLTVIGENPVKVEEGAGSVRFALSFGDGAEYLGTDGAADTFENGILTVPATAGRTVRVFLSRAASLTLEADARGSLTVVSGTDETGAAHTGREVLLQGAPNEHYTLAAVEVNGERLPAMADGSFSFIPEGDSVLHPIFEGEALSVRFGTSRLGEITDLTASPSYRYGDSLRLQATYDESQVKFLGWSEGSELEDGGVLLGEEPLFETTLQGDLAVYANFVSRATFYLSIDAGEGAFGEGKAPGQTEHSPGEYLNLPVDDLGLSREGYLPVGYTDGEREYAFGAMLVMPREDISLTVVWKEISPADWFRFSDGTLLGFSEAGKTAAPGEIVIPQRINGKKVTKIASDAFAGCDFLRSVELPVGLATISGGAFRGCENLVRVCFPETITELSSSAFSACPAFSEMRVHASLGRVYDVDYDSALADKYMRLKETAGDEKRIILVGGSGMSFGIESDVLKEAFPGYTVVNFSTSVYYGSRPLYNFLEHAVKPGDVVVFAMEYRDYMYGIENDGMTNWQYLESNYDMLCDLDLRENKVLIDTYLKYLQGKRSYLRRGVKKYNSLVYSRASFDLDGDLAAFRKGLGEGASVSSSLPRTSILTDEGLAWMKQAMQKLVDRGAVCCMSYPAAALPDGYTQSSIRERTKDFTNRLESALAGVCTPVSEPADYYLSPSLIYDSMYHFCSEGAVKRTEILARDLAKVISAEGGNGNG